MTKNNIILFKQKNFFTFLICQFVRHHRRGSKPMRSNLHVFSSAKHLQRFGKYLLVSSNNDVTYHKGGVKGFVTRRWQSENGPITTKQKCNLWTRPYYFSHFEQGLIPVLLYQKNSNIIHVQNSINYSDSILNVNFIKRSKKFDALISKFFPFSLVKK